MKRAVLLLSLCLACSNSTGPVIDGRRLAVLDQYSQWWRELEGCSGLRGNLSAVAFYSVESIPGQAIGRYQLKGGKQTIELVFLFLNDEPIVKHEMMHALLYNVGGHPSEYFNGKCGDLRNGNTYN
jgi:hypothetical protein